MSALRVALVSEHANPLERPGGAESGGQNVHVDGLAAALVRLGCEVVVHTRRSSPTQDDLVRAPAGYLVHHADAGPATPLLRDELLPHMDELARSLTTMWHGRRPDVVHAHFWMSGVAALKAADTFCIPVLQTFHALGVVKRRMQGPADTSPRCRVEVERHIARSVDRIVATAEDEVRELIALGAEPTRLAIVPCGVDPAVFSPEGPADPPTPGRRRIVAVGRLVARKGLADVIRAVAALADVELMIVGGPPLRRLFESEEAIALGRLASDLGVADRVVWRGGVGAAGVAAALRGADLAVCVPWYEPFGMAAVEAMACGVPVVASAVGGLAESVVDGVTGVLVPPRCPSALAEMLTSLLADPERRRCLGAAGALRARALYAWDTVAAATHVVYQDALRSAAGIARPLRLAQLEEAHR